MPRKHNWDTCYENEIALVQETACFESLLIEYALRSQEEIERWGLSLRGPEKSPVWVPQDMNGKSDTFLEEIDGKGMAFASSWLAIDFTRSLSRLSGHDMRLHFANSFEGLAGEVIAFADGTCCQTIYDAPWEAPSWLYERLGNHPCGENTLSLDAPIPDGWGRLLTETEQQRALHLLLERRSTPRSLQGSLATDLRRAFVRADYETGFSDGRLYLPATNGEIRPVAFAWHEERSSAS